MKIVLYSDDINLLSHWEKSLQDSYVVVESLEELYGVSDSIAVMNYTACEGDCSRVLERLSQQKNRVLILDRTPLFERAQKLLRLGAYGYGNAIMRDHFIVAAIGTIKENMIWLYPEFTSELIKGITPSDKNRKDSLALLSQREKDVALLLKDGETYKEIGEKLQITPRTVKAHAQSIYTKLQVKDRLALALLLR